MIRLLTIAALTGALTLAGTVRADDLAKLEGTYTIVSGEKGGEKIPSERIEGSLLTITKDKITGTDKEKKEFFASTYVIDEKAKPHRITMVSTAPKAGEKAMGIIAMDGDNLKICYALPGGDAPTEFKTKDKQQCFVLKRKTADK